MVLPNHRTTNSWALALARNSSNNSSCTARGYLFIAPLRRVFPPSASICRDIPTVHYRIHVWVLAPRFRFPALCPCPTKFIKVNPKSISSTLGNFRTISLRLLGLSVGPWEPLCAALIPLFQNPTPLSSQLTALKLGTFPKYRRPWLSPHLFPISSPLPVLMLNIPQLGLVVSPLPKNYPSIVYYFGHICGFPYEVSSVKR